MTPRQLDILEEQSTQRPWRVIAGTPESKMVGIHASDCKIYHASFEQECLRETHDRQVADAKLIAAMRNIFPELKAIADSLSRLLDTEKGIGGCIDRNLYDIDEETRYALRAYRTKLRGEKK